MKKEWTDEELDFLSDELKSIRNMISLTLLAVEDGEVDLIPTALETAYEQIQYLVDEYCVVDERN